MIGLGLGPSISGWLIDFFKSDYEDINSMRYAMTAISCVFIPSIISFDSYTKVAKGLGDSGKK